MKFTIPNSVPSKNEFITKFVETIFPDMEALGLSRNAYGYLKASESLARQLHVYQGDDCDCVIDENGLAFRIMYETNAVGERILGSCYKRQIDFSDRNQIENYGVNISNICNSSQGSLRNWLSEDTKKINYTFDAAFFLSFLFFAREGIELPRKEFFQYVLEVAGITEMEEAVISTLFDFHPDETEAVSLPGGAGKSDLNFRRVKNKATILFLAAVHTIIYSLGRFSDHPDDFENIFENLHLAFQEYLADEMKADRHLTRAENNLIECIQYFEPRSIVTSESQLYPQDFFVFPNFEGGKESPLKSIRSAKKSRRFLIRAKTGLGKSSYLKMSALCLLHKKYQVPVSDPQAFLEISEQLGVPDDMTVLFIPARMFTYCYRNERYREWTDSFETLFFKAMWELYPTNNFFLEQGTQNTGNIQEEEDHPVLSDVFTDYLTLLAKKGKLILLLDSYDEISSGEVRGAYLKALTTFYDKYCCFLSEDVGAHVIITSREMSPATMNLINSSLEMDPKEDVFEISVLNDTQRRELLRRWDRFLGIDGEESRSRLSQIENNHFYSDYSSNPYMFSVICFYLGHNMKEITQKYIDGLVNKMQKNNRTADLKNNSVQNPIIQNVLRNIEKIMQDIAAETVINDKTVISRKRINRAIEQYIDNTDLSQSELEKYIERLHDIFVVEVGFIVPADGEDVSYQFINDQLRYELAARGFQRGLDKEEMVSVYRTTILPYMKNIKEYVGMFVPLICSVGEDVELSELLLSDLAMHEFESDAEDRLLLQSMIDLILNRYGSNILTIDKSGENVAKYVRRAQREIMLRILGSPNFVPGDQEKSDIKACPAFRNHLFWFCDELKRKLD